MTTFAQAEAELISEVQGRIIDLVPEVYPEYRFCLREEADKALSDFDEEQMIPRLFEIGTAMRGEARHVGYNNRGDWYRYHINFHYPRGEQRWNTAAASDQERIYHDLIRNATTVSGVQNRRIDPEAEVEIEPDADDPWMIMRMTMLVLYNIDGT
jgi:hypothetical protein